MLRTIRSPIRPVRISLTNSCIGARPIVKPFRPSHSIQSGLRFNSTDSVTQTAASVTSAVSEIKSEIAAIAPEKFPEFVQAATEVVSSDQIGYFQSVGLAQSWWWPPDAFQHVFELVHVYSGLPWWASIMAVTVAFRALLLPMYFIASHHSALMNKIKPELNKITSEYTKMDDPMHAQKLLIKRKRLLEVSGVKSSRLMLPMLGFPFFVGIFAGINRMCKVPVDGLVDQGLYWFQNLAVPDPYLGLQLITAIVYATSIKLGGETGANSMSPGMKKVFVYMPFIAVPLTMGVPAATCLYFATNSVISVVQTLALRSSTVRSSLGLAPLITPPHDPNAENLSAFETMKRTFEKAKERAEKAAREQEREANLRAEAKRIADGQKVVIERKSPIASSNKGKKVTKGDVLRG